MDIISTIRIGNEKICDFVGLRKELKDKMAYDFGADINLTAYDYFVITSDYHRSWDALHGVIEKIESIGENNNNPKDNYHFRIGKRITEVIYDWDTYFLGKVDTPEDFEKFNNSFKSYRHSLFNEDKLYSTWQAVVDFIEWYNLKNK